MKKILFLILALVALFAIPAFAQFDAGFLDNSNGIANPSAFNGANWYCLNHTYEWDPVWQMYMPVTYIVSGGFSSYPNCSAG